MVFGAFVSATFFSLHPLRVESVAWVSDRKDLLMTFFLLLSSGAYLLYSVGYDTPEGRRWYVVAFVSAFLAMLSKTVASMFPVVLIMADAFLLRQPGDRRIWSRLLKDKIPFVLGSIFVGAFSVVAVTGILRHPKLYERTTLEEVLLPAYTWTFYILKNLWPTGLTPVYVHPPMVELILSLLFVGCITVVCLLLLKRKAHFWLLAWGFYLLFLLPTILGKERAGIQPWADRYSYLPSVAVAMLFGAFVIWLWNKPTLNLKLAVGAFSLAVLVFLGLATTHQIPVWHDTITLFRYAAATNPSAIMAHTNLGLALAATGRPDEAMASLERAIALNDRYAGSYEVMALACDQKGERDRAIGLYRKAISLDTNFIEAYSNLGNTLMALERYDDAIQEYLAAIRKDPEFFDAYYNMGIAHYRKGDPSAAMEVFRRAAVINPINSDTYLNMGIIYSDWGDEEAAFAQYQKAADLGNAQAKQLLGPRFQRR
jgi:Tfp pilus assembly protein PilF